MAQIDIVTYLDSSLAVQRSTLASLIFNLLPLVKGYIGGHTQLRLGTLEGSRCCTIRSLVVGNPLTSQSGCFTKHLPFGHSREILPHKIAVE